MTKGVKLSERGGVSGLTVDSDPADAECRVVSNRYTRAPEILFGKVTQSNGSKLLCLLSRRALIFLIVLLGGVCELKHGL